MIKDTKDKVVIRFAGDSGDGIQVIGDQMSNSSIIFGNDIRTFPDFPAEIRAPAGSFSGVSCFQICFSSKNIYTTGSKFDVLVALNPAGLISNLDGLKLGGILIVDKDKFNDKNCKRAGYLSNPLFENDFKRNYNLFDINISSMVSKIVDSFGVRFLKFSKYRNMFVLGIIYWMYNRDVNTTIRWIENKFSNKFIVDLNKKILCYGYNYALTSKFTERTIVGESSFLRGKYKNISGNKAIALGILSIARLSNIPMFVTSYPITPASGIFDELIKNKFYKFCVIQMEDEIAAAGAAIGASYGGSLSLLFTSGPGLDLITESLGLSLISEIPIVVVNVQRCGPSTGMPTKSEQTDLLSSVFGRHGECQVVVLSAFSSTDCFWVIFEAFNIAFKYMIPVIVLSDSNLAMSSEPWKVPNAIDLDMMQFSFFENIFSNFLYRNKKNFLKKWTIPGIFNKTNCLGGLEKNYFSGQIDYSPHNHNKMCKFRMNKLKNISLDIPDVEVYGNFSGFFLLISWGSTYGVSRSIFENLYKNGYDIAFLNLRYINPLPRNLKNILNKYKKIAVLEMNLGQLSYILRSNFLVEIFNVECVISKQINEEEITNSVLKFF